MDTATSLFFTLLRSGLWGTEPVLPPSQGAAEARGGNQDTYSSGTSAATGLTDCDNPGGGITPPDLEIWKRAYRLATEQTVAGLVTDGAAVCPSGYVPGVVSLKLMSTRVATEKRNAAINAMIARVIPLFDEAGIPTVLVKGQAVARCYSRPEGRMPGDIDLMIRPEDYDAAKAVLSGIADDLESENLDKMHFGAMIGDIEIELHGTVHTSLGNRINDILDSAQAALFEPGGCRSIDIGGTRVRIPSIDFDAMFIFVHLLQHFYCGGLGLRQLCDWTMVLHSHYGEIDRDLLKTRLKEMGIMSEWQAFLAFIVRYLGLPEQEAPLYSRRAEAKADKLWKFMEKVGNFGKKRRRRDHSKDPYLIRKIESFCRNSKDFLNHATVFPLDSVKFFWMYFTTGTKVVLRGE